MKVIVFIPALNEEDSIAHVIQKVPRHFHPSVKVEVLVIDDGSTDRTVDVAKKAGADHIVSFEKTEDLVQPFEQVCRRAIVLGLILV